MRPHWASATWTIALLSIASLGAAQSGGVYDLRHGTIDSGGVTFASGGSYRIGSSIGQPSAGSSSGGIYSLGAGFWGGGQLVAAPTPTLTQTPTMQTTSTSTATIAPTTTPSSSPRPPTPTNPIVAATHTPSRSPTRSQSPVTSTTATPTASPTPTSPSLECAGDCDDSGRVSVDELVRGVNIALERTAVSQCSGLDTDGSGRVTVSELVAAVNAALRGC